MLEQRPYTRYFEPTDAEDLEWPNNIEKGTYPIEIKFVSRGGLINVDPAQTNSQNLSQFATSSVPYFDIFTSKDVGKQRPNMQPDSATEVTITL